MDTTRRTQRARRPLAIASAAVLALTLTPLSASADNHTDPEPRGTDRVCPAPEDATVTDAPTPGDIDGTTHEASIDCALDYGLVLGQADGDFAPNTAVTRGQMATFAANWIEAATGLALDAPDEDVFTDVAGTTHAQAIGALREAGIVSGRTDGTFGPNDQITRGQQARFVAGAIDYADSLAVDGSLPPLDDTTYFTDVAGTTFEADILAIAGVGIVQGTGNGLYSPNAIVTRGQLATFLMSAADYLDSNMRWLPTAFIETYEVALAGMNEVGADGMFGAGQQDATGTATLVIDAFNGTMDVDLDYANVDGPFNGEGSPGAHIHMAPIDENGPVVIAFATGQQLQDAAGDLQVTVTEDVEALRFAELIENPDAFYVNVHSDAFQAGAVRGQLPNGGQDLLEPTEFALTMTGAAEVGGAGELTATAAATLEVDYVTGEIAYTVDVSDVTGPFDAAPGFHIHVGDATENGPIVAFLADGAAVAAAAAGDGMLTGTFTDASPEVLRALVEDSANYYLNLHSNDFPGGAVRAQLG